MSRTKAYTTWGEWRVAKGETDSEVIATVLASNKKEAQQKAIDYARRTEASKYFSRYFRFHTVQCGDPKKAVA